MPFSLSVYLDAVRLGAALVVVLYHIGAPQLGGGWFAFPNVGRSAVIVFFVISGFVIAFAAEKRDKTLVAYTASRLARLWSVLIPALVITYVVDAIGMEVDPTVYEGWEGWMAWDYPLLRLLSAGLFVNEIWFFSVAPLSNLPLWSLSFEFWYYVFFAFAFYLRGRARIVCCLAAALIAGPKILLLLPCWWIGVFVYRRMQTAVIPPPVGWILFIGPVFVYVVLTAASTRWHLMVMERWALGEWLGLLKYAEEFLWFYSLAFLTAAHFTGVYALRDRFARAAEWLRWIRKPSSYTFAIYVLHHPLLMLLSATLHDMPAGPTRTGLMLAATLLACCLIGEWTERRRGALKQFLVRLFTGRAKLVPAV